MEGVGRQSVTDVLRQLHGGNSEAMDQLLPLVYDDLRRMAHRRLQGERPGHSLGTTGLVHELYLKLTGNTQVEWRDRGHFFAFVAQGMRRILVDHARRCDTARRGGDLQRVSLSDEALVAERSEMLLALDAALDRLETLNARLSQVVACRFFGGLTEAETAEALGVTTRTVQRDWAKARGWLYLELAREES